MPLSPEDDDHLGRACDWVDFNRICWTSKGPDTPQSRANLEEARSEYNRISPEGRRDVAVLKLSAYVHRSLEDWPELALAGAELAKLFPNDPRWLIDWASGARFSESVEAARDVVENGASLHGGNPEFQLERARYAALLGDNQNGLDHLSTATAAGGGAISGKALREPDFQPLLERLTLEQKIAILHL